MPARKKPSLKKETPLEEIIGSPAEVSKDSEEKAKQENPEPVVMPIQTTAPSSREVSRKDKGDTNPSLFQPILFPAF